MTNVSQQRPNAPSERAGGGLEVSPTTGIRRAVRVLAVAVENSFQEALPDAKGSVEDLRGDPIVPRALPDQREWAGDEPQPGYGLPVRRTGRNRSRRTA